MKILVTGATGFVGTNLVKELGEQGYTCRCLVRDKNQAKSLVNNQQSKIELWEGDITKPSTLRGISKDINIVFHLAAHGHVAASSKEAYLQFLKINVKGTENLIKDCLVSPISKFFHFSSTAAVGLIEDILVDENVKPNPKTPYQRSKLESEKVVLKYIKKGFPGIIFRPCMIYGIGGLGEFYKFSKLIKKGFMPKIGSKEKLTPIVNVKDVVQACLKGIKRARVGETYLICSEKSYPFDDICSEMSKSLGVKWPKLRIPESLAIFGVKLLEKGFKVLKKPPIVTSKNIKSTIADRRFSIQKAKKDFGYSPDINLARGIDEVIKWYRKNRLIK
jgi:nucleoside-diphosphate-sugar epimerase